MKIRNQRPRRIARSQRQEHTENWLRKHVPDSRHPVDRDQAGVRMKRRHPIFIEIRYPVMVRGSGIP
jgi:hypothetical protein